VSAVKQSTFAVRVVLLRLFLAITATAWLAAAPAMADDAVPDKASLEAKKAALFQQMLRDPSNLDVTFAYADVAAQLGDNEAAVAALERMLLFNPNLPRVDLELGVLYFRMGSYEAAQSYFDKAKSFNPPPEVTERVDDYLARIHTAEQASQLSGFFFMGSQYQTDANVAPGSPLIHSPIGDVLLSNQFVKHDDANIFATGSVLYSYDIGNQDRDTIEVSGTGFANHYMQFKRLDLDLGEVTAGPRFRYPSAPWIDDLTFKPYVILNEVGLGENQYFWTYGVGLEFTGVFLGDVSAKIAWEFREKNFTDAPDRPLSRGLTGNDNLLTLTLTKPITPNSALSFEFDYLDQATRLTYYANMDYSVSVGYRIRYDDPTGLIKFPWETVIFGSRSYSIYQSPDPCCNTSPDPSVFSASDRFDRHWRFGVTQSFQVAPNIAVVLQAQRDIVSSNLSIYAYTSDSVLIGPQIRF
jgi:tetratricopeptide (TPR) repeat protein